MHIVCTFILPNSMEQDHVSQVMLYTVSQELLLQRDEVLSFERGCHTVLYILLTMLQMHAIV